MYLYDADDERVAAVTYIDGQNSVWRYALRDETGHVLRTVTATISGGVTSWQQSEDYVYRGTSLLAAISPQGSGETRKHFHLDHLGSPVLITDDSGQRLSSHKYWPFGMEVLGGTSDGERMKFTGHERDGADINGNGLDYMHARYYNGVAGRFLSADPHIGKTGDPQSWNRYAYVKNNPLAQTDPTGLDTKDFLKGAGDGFVSDMSMFLPHHDPRGDKDYARGQEYGDRWAIMFGLSEVASGVGGASGGGALAFVSGGAGSGVLVMSVGQVIHGTAAVIRAVHHIHASQAASTNNGSSDDTKKGDEEVAKEDTPSTTKDAFGPVRGTKGKINKQTGEIWEHDMLHKDHWEVYRNRKDYDNGKRDRAVWDDGRLKEKFD
jgi:RHS repeat-associated protein